MSNISESDLSSFKGSTIISHSIPEELKQRLSLYRVFVKLYENHGSLLEQILRLEGLWESSLESMQSYYLQAVLDGEAVYVTTNLRDGKSQSLRQSQYTWTIGRDRSNGIHIHNKYISRRHAAIRYVDQGFYLIDLNSTNGTYINGEQIYKPTKLEDGDIVRIGNITFPFFINSSCYALPTVAVELLMQLIPKSTNCQTEASSYDESTTKKFFDDEVEQMRTFEQQITQEWKSKVLDRFYRQQALKDSVRGDASN